MYTFEKHNFPIQYHELALTLRAQMLCYSHAMTLEEGTGMADEENRRGKLHHPVTDPPNHIHSIIYFFLVSLMCHHKEEPIKT